MKVKQLWPLPGVSWAFSTAHPSEPATGGVVGPTLLEQKPRALSLSWLFPLSVGVLPTPTSVSPASGVLGRGCSSHSSTVWDRFMQ